MRRYVGFLWNRRPPLETLPIHALQGCHLTRWVLQHRVLFCEPASTDPCVSIPLNHSSCLSVKLTYVHLSPNWGLHQQPDLTCKKWENIQNPIAQIKKKSRVANELANPDLLRKGIVCLLPAPTGWEASEKFLVHFLPLNRKLLLHKREAPIWNIRGFTVSKCNLSKVKKESSVAQQNSKARYLPEM